MGIHNFHSWLKEFFPKAYTSFLSNNIFDHIYLDVNFILHNNIYFSQDEDDFIKRVYHYFDLIFSNVIATKTIYFCLDGVAPLAKLGLQTRRRENNLNKTSNKGLNNLWLTPGTDFMNKLHRYLNIYFDKLSKRYKFVEPKILFSDSNQPNEGEIKIGKKLLENLKKDSSCKNLIIGNDADLIVLSMALTPYENIYILFKNKKEYELISIKEIINKLYQLGLKDKNILRDEFVIVSLLLGNDYLPKLGYTNMEKVWSSYFKTVKHDEGGYFIKNLNFNFKNMEKFILELYNNLTQSFKKPILNIKTNQDRVKAYLEGILWCFNMYKTGECSKYDYKYNNNKIIHPYELLFFLATSQNKIELPVSKAKPIDLQSYLKLILPSTSSKLIKS